jgi:hypothetical protein
MAFPTKHVGVERNQIISFDGTCVVGIGSLFDSYSPFDLKNDQVLCTIVRPEGPEITLDGRRKFTYFWLLAWKHTR